MDTDTIHDSRQRQLNVDKCRMRTVFAVLSSAMLLLIPVQVGSQQERYQTFGPREVALLPSYCKHTLLFRQNVPGGNNPAEIKRWTSALGDTFRHMHHYCFGLMATNKATISPVSRRERLYLLRKSIDEFNYVIRHAPADFVVLPEILTRKGENLIRLDLAPQGIVELQRAVELKPDYWPPYAHLSDYYKKTGNTASAREWLEKGLSASPDAKALQLRLVELGGIKNKPTSAPQ